MANGLSPKFSTKLPTKIQTGLGTSATVYSSPSNTSPNNLGRKLPEGSYYSLEEAFAGFHVKNGFSRANRYEVLLNPPSGGNTAFAQVLRNYVGDGTVRQTGLRCEQISFPGRNLDTTPDTNIYGPTREIVSGFSFADVSATFVCSADMKEKLFFETWQRLAFDPQTWSLGYYFDYVGAVDIIQLDEQNNKRYGVQLIEAFPKTISQQSLGYASNNTLHKINVTFSYRYWKNLTDEADLPKPITVERESQVTERRTNANTPAVQKKLGEFLTTSAPTKYTFGIR